jgi:hypothetical protein
MEMSENVSVFKKFKEKMVTGDLKRSDVLHFSIFSVPFLITGFLLLWLNWIVFKSVSDAWSIYGIISIAVGINVLAIFVNYWLTLPDRIRASIKTMRNRKRLKKFFARKK